MSNFYKPKYKINYNTLSKIGFYKNSRLYKFIDKRGKRKFRRGFGHRRQLKLKNSKWFTIRRFLIPRRFKKRFRNKYKFKQNLINKKRIQLFYGKYDAKKFKKLFLVSYKHKRLNRLQSFVYYLEQRLDIILLRLKILPTISSIDNFIKYYGILVNNTKIIYPYKRIEIGDIISFPSRIW